MADKKKADKNKNGIIGYAAKKKKKHSSNFS